MQNRQFDNGIEEVEDAGYLVEDGEHLVIKAAVYEDKAYWVYDNVFYESEIMHEPDWETARPIDTMQLDQQELSKLLNILDELE